MRDWMNIKGFFFITIIILLTSIDTVAISATIQAEQSNTINPNEVLMVTENSVKNDQINETPYIQLQEQILELEKEINYLKTDMYKAEASYFVKYYEYLGKKAEINLSQFMWQKMASNWLLFLVIVVVISGVVFSGFQLWKASQIDDFGKSSSIELSVQRIKITSSVVGVIVLSISIVFLYFFLIEVYRINIVDIAKSETLPLTINQP